jgi:hypothetical protein
MKIETGVMVMKDGKAWGRTYEDGQSTCDGWMDPESAEIHDPRFCLLPTDVTWQGSHYTKDLSTAKVVKVKRTTTVEVL